MLRDIRMWPQIIDELFLPFAIKSVAKRHFILRINTLGKMTESILDGVKMEDIPLKSYHILFSPI